MAGPSIAEYDVRGTSIKLMRAGKGPPLLLLRGTDASDAWLPWMDKLAEKHAVIVPEHPGFGGKPIPPWLDRVSDLANFYLDFIDTLKLQGLHLVGTSLGGWIATDIAHRGTPALASLTLVGAAGIRLPEVDGVDVFMRTEEEGLRDRFHDAKRAEAVAARMLAPDSEDVRLSNAITIARVAWNPRLFDPHLQRWLHRIKVPTAIVWGEHDRILPKAYALAFQQGIAGASVTIVPDCGHWVAHEKPDHLVKTILDTTSGLDHASGQRRTA